MKLPLAFNKKEDIPAIKWLIKFTVLYLFLSQIMWYSDWFQPKIVQPYTKVLAWELEKSLNLIGFEFTRVQSTLIFQDSNFRVKIITRCTAFWGGYLVFFAVVTTLPAQSFKSRIFWLAVGTAFIHGFNLLRLTFLISLSSNDPSIFEPLHNILRDFNILAGGGISLFVVHRMSLVPAGVRVFKRRAGQSVEEEQASRLVDENSAG